VQDDAKLRRLYPRAPWIGLLSAFPARSRDAILARAAAIGVARKIKSNTGWTGREKVTLRRIYPGMPRKTIQTALPRHSWAGIARMASAMGVRRKAIGASSNLPIIRSLRDTRRDRGLSQADLSKRIGIRDSHLSQWERGALSPKLRGLIDWCEALDVSLTITQNRSFHG
jgi:DNA-binding XRE family transcriptional regulator